MHPNQYKAYRAAVPSLLETALYPLKPRLVNGFEFQTVPNQEANRTFATPPPSVVK